MDEPTTLTTELKKAFTKVFQHYYDEEISEILGEMHSIFHARFAQAMASGPGHEPGEEKAPLNTATRRMAQALRRARKGDVLPPGPTTDILNDEIMDMLSSAGEMSMSEIKNAAIVTDCPPDVIRVAVTRLMRDGKIERVETSGKMGRYRCAKAT